jgi:2,3-bisphosphoglycerate-independent phosphoglycerate mutase
MSKAALFILDGWGLGPKPSSDAIANAKTPYFHSLMANYPHSTLVTYGEDVGLPEGQMGNSEVGHLNIGAGRIVWQELARINKAIRDGSFSDNEVLAAAFQHARDNKVGLHFMGLVSDGGVHSHIRHLEELCSMTSKYGVEKAYIHAFTDGRDCDPKSGLGFIEQLLDATKDQPVELATIIGRYYAMDRDKRWERVKIAYDLMVFGEGEVETSPLEAIQQQYDAGITDEFLPAMVVTREGMIQPDDVVIAFNFRTDRCREISQVLTQQDMPEYDMQALSLYYVTMTRYDETFHDVKVVYEKDDISLTMGEVLENAGKTQVRIAETEKYPHVTFFFSGGREVPFEGERRLMVPSAKVATYDLQPEMSALEITEAIMKDIKEMTPDFICLNFANADMVGHTGVFSAAIKAAETVDQCMAQIVPLALENGYDCIVIADHGNSDYMINEDGSPNTAHTMNPVPCIIVSNKGIKSVKNGRLADVAPTLLDLMGVQAPPEMTGESLVTFK